MAEFCESEDVVFALTDLGGQHCLIRRAQQPVTAPPPNGLNIARTSLVIEGMWMGEAL